MGWGAGPRWASRDCRKTGQGLLWLGVSGVPSGWTGTAGRCSRARLCPLECAASPPCSSCPPWSLFFPTWSRWAVSSGAVGHFPHQHLPLCHLPSRSQQDPAPEPSLRHPLTVLGTPSPAARGAEKGQQPLLACRRSHRGAQSRPVISEGSQLPYPELGAGTGRVVKGACQHLEGGRARLWGGSRGWGLSGSSSLPALPAPSAPRTEGKHRLTRTCPPAGSAPGGTEPGAEGHPHPGARPPLAAPPRARTGARVLRR